MHCLLLYCLIAAKISDVCRQSSVNLPAMTFCSRISSSQVQGRQSLLNKLSVTCASFSNSNFDFSYWLFSYVAFPILSFPLAFSEAQCGIGVIVNPLNPMLSSFRLTTNMSSYSFSFSATASTQCFCFSPLQRLLHCRICCRHQSSSAT